MATYNDTAGKNLGRIAALSDGIFAVAMTILVLDIHVPEASGIHTNQELLNWLIHFIPSLLPFLLSFMTLGIFWMGQSTQMHSFKSSDRHLQWIFIGFLVFVCLLPFSTRLLAQFITLQAALMVYWVNILVLGLMLLWSWCYARRAGHVDPDMLSRVGQSFEKRVLYAQLWYFGAMLLGFIDTHLGIAGFIVIQLDYAIAPRFSRSKTKSK